MVLVVSHRHDPSAGRSRSPPFSERTYAVDGAGVCSYHGSHDCSTEGIYIMKLTQTVAMYIILLVSVEMGGLLLARVSIAERSWTRTSVIIAIMVLIATAAVMEHP